MENKIRSLSEMAVNQPEEKGTQLVSDSGRAPFFFPKSNLLATKVTDVRHERHREVRYATWTVAARISPRYP